MGGHEDIGTADAEQKHVDIGLMRPHSPSSHILLFVPVFCAHMYGHPCPLPAPPLSPGDWPSPPFC